MKAYHQGQLDFCCAIYAFINALKLVAGFGLADGRRILGETLREISARPALWEPFLDNNTDHYWVVRYLLGRYCRSGRFACRAAFLPQAPLDGAERRELRRQREQGEHSLKLYGATDHELGIWLGLHTPEELDLDTLERDILYRRESGEAGQSGQPGRMCPSERELRWPMEELWPLLQSWLPLRRLFGGLSGFGPPGAPGGEGGQQTRCLLLRFHRYLYMETLPVVSHWSTGREFAGDVLHLFDCTADKEAIHSLSFRETAASPAQLGAGRLLQLEPDSLVFIEKV
ncbi:MAG: hypothetical protein LBM64_07820 [Deltaproteobacteria bacterium]|jgi:hypothetical protein|nr:hypothetical protein [Deltaproteobacteria bacterium]